tara:strand:+ start:15334 stop:16497 length:1164 start_codon:yes stop_codon:yes gene_type:complete
MSQVMDRKDYEVIVVDDASTDKSMDILNDFKTNIKIIKNKKNLGVAESVNKAVKISKGEYFVRVDSDDYISSYFIMFLYNSFRIFPKKFAVACDYFHIDENEKIINKLSASAYPISCGIMYNKKKFIKFGMYNPKFKHREEEEIRLRLGNKYNLYNLNIPLYKYKIHQNNKTKSNKYLIDFRKKIDSLKTKKNFKELNSHKLLKNLILIIPARGNSKRFKDKNIFQVQGKPMIAWPILEAKKSSLIKDIYVSSESKKILDVAKKFGAKKILRPSKLSKDNVFKLEVIKHAVIEIEKKTKKKVTSVISLQANSPEIKLNHIENTIKKLIIDRLQEVITVDIKNNCNAAIRFMTRSTLFQKSLSTNHGFLHADVKDIHFKEEINNLKKL